MDNQKITLRDIKVPLIATGIATLLAVIAVIVIGTVIFREKISDRRKMERVEMLGSGLGVMTVIAVAPFWLIAASKIAKRRRGAGDGK